MKDWIRLAIAAINLAISEVAAGQRRRRARAAHANDPRSHVLVRCEQCGASVRADAASRAAHLAQAHGRITP